MANSNTYEALIALAEQIRTNETLHSNTNELIGSTLRALIEKLETVGGLNETEVQQLRAALNTETTNRTNADTNLSSQISTINTELASINTAIGNAQTTANNAQQSANNAQTAAGAAQSSANAAQSSADAAQTSANAAQTAANNNATAINRLNAALTALNELLGDDFESALNNGTLSSVIYALDGAISNLQRTVGGHSIELQNISSQIDGMERDVYQLQSAKKDHDTALSTLETSTGHIARDLDTVEEIVSGHAQRISDNEDEIAGLSGAISGMSKVAGIYNVTNEKPIQGYYSLIDTQDVNASAAHVALADGKNVSGLIISFAISRTVWKTYQYIGANTQENAWLSAENWKDFGSLAAGSEPYIIIDSLCGSPTVGDYYTLETAVQALLAYQQTSGVTYAKKGLIISYAIGENVMETKQFQGEVTDIGIVALWKDFGGGGSDVETSDDPEEDGEDAFSTGGAYNHLPAGIDIDTETEGVVKMKLVNAAGEDVTDEVQFTVGTGSGGGSGTTIAVAFRNNPLYGNAGGSFVLQAAIMSVTKAGSQETTNSIAQVSFINRTTKREVAVFKPRQASSASMQNYSFSFDLSSLCAEAGELPLQTVITDDSGNTATKNVSIVAVNVTCVSAQTLHYTRDTTLEVGGISKNIPMYAFPHYASDRGINTVVQMKVGNEWRTIQETLVQDSYTHSVRIDPTGLAHGAYPLRIQGTDVASGVQGNILYTTVMVIEQNEESANYNTPIVAARWSEKTTGTLRRFENVSLDLACYCRNQSLPTVTVTLYNETTSESKVLTQQQMARTTTYNIVKRLVEFEEGDALAFRASCGMVVQPQDLEVLIDGTLLPIEETEGAYFGLDFYSRSNSDSDKSITAECSDGNSVEISVVGSNWSTNGFVKDSFGTDSYGTADDDGVMSLRIAEDVTATSDIAPFSNPSIETNGSAFSFTTKIKNVADPSAELIACKGVQSGFLLTGEKLVVYTNGLNVDTSQVENAVTIASVPYSLDEVHRFDIVVEPSSLAPYGGIGVIKIYKDGEEVGALKYTAGAFPTNEECVSFDGSEADVYLYSMKMWNTYYNFMQAFNNYLVGMQDSDLMVREYGENDVMAAQTAEGVTRLRPSMQKCLDAGLCVVVLTKSPGTDDIAKSYPDYLEGLDGDKKTTIPLDWYVYFPDRPWQDFIVSEDPTSNQGTTSSWRKIKNKKAKHKKSKGMRLMRTREEISEMFGGDESILAKYDLAASMARKNKIQIVDGGQFTNITTIKVDYSDSCGAHNGAMMDLMNQTQIALGRDYMTPAQIYNEGDFEIHTSIDSIPCALFRTDHNQGSVDACDPANAYFHAKGNFNADKGDAAFYGFEKTPGYNAACLNYGDFIELVASENQTLNDFKTVVLADTSSLIAGNIYVLSEYCGPDHVVLENDGSGSMVEVGAVDTPTEIEETLAEVQAASVDDYSWNIVYLTSDGHYVQYQGGQWTETTGTMTFDNATKKWSVTGRVVNPVECYEYLKYDSLNWCQGVDSAADMMAIDPSTGHPVWMSYYESRYPDDDDLNDKYERGLKVPYQLYRWLHFCQQCNQHLTSSDGNIKLDGSTVSGTRANRLLKWQHELHKYANVKSTLCYTVASDYKAAVDQRSKNMMISFYLETDGLMRAYFNHWYDGDCVDGSDNDCGLTIPWDMDARTSHLYQGWDSVMFVQTYAATAFWLNDSGSETVTLSAVADAMRKVERNNIRLFSPEGCYYFWVTKRLAKWAKVISSFDGERKYIENSTASDNYFYALHGLRLDDLPDYQRKRFKYCDGQYQVGDLYTNPFKARMMGAIEITITAAQDGFFGLGEDRADACADSCHLLAGESYTLRANTAQEAGKMIYVFGADKLSKLDISACTPKQEAFSLEYCTLLKELIVGGANYTPAYTTGLLSSLELPAMPFLRKVDIRNTNIQTLTTGSCPRLLHVLAEGSQLRNMTLAEASPINDVQLPATMTDIAWVGLPNLEYDGLGESDGVRVPSLGSVRNVQIERSPNVDVVTFIEDLLSGQSTLQLANLRIASQIMQGTAAELMTLMERGGSSLRGKDSSGTTTAKPVIDGTYGLTTIIDQEDVDTLEGYYEGLSIATLIEAFIDMIDEVNGEGYGGAAEVQDVSLENIDTLALTYYNGESYEDYYSNYINNEY